MSKVGPFLYNQALEAELYFKPQDLLLPQGPTFCILQWLPQNRGLCSTEPLAPFGPGQESGDNVGRDGNCSSVGKGAGRGVRPCAVGCALGGGSAVFPCATSGGTVCVGA